MDRDIEREQAEPGAAASPSSLQLADDALTSRAKTWAAQPVPRKKLARSSETIDFGALKIFLILVFLTVGMTLILKYLI